MDRLIYAYEFPDGSAYVGLTRDLAMRQSCRKGDCKDAVTIYIKNTSLEPVIKTLTELMSSSEARVQERQFIEEYRSKGWKMLNRNRGGSLGGNDYDYSTWTKDKCWILAMISANRTILKENCPEAYKVAHANCWLDEFFGPSLTIKEKYRKAEEEWYGKQK